MFALKVILSLAVGFLAVAADVARPGSVARVNGDNWHTCHLGLVLHEAFQLKESPIAETAAKAFRNRWLDAVADEGQILQCYPNAECLCFRHNALTDPMVLCGLKATLLAAHPFQFPLGVLSSLPLVLFASGLPASTIPVDFLTRECFSGAICGDTDDTKVNAQEVGHFDRWFFLKFNRCHQVKLSVAVHEVTLPLDAVKSFSLILAIDKPDRLPSIQRGEANLVQPLEAKISLIVGNSAIRTKYGAYSLVSGEAFDRLSYSANCQLCGQAELLADRKVCQLVNAWLAEYSSLKSDARGKGSCLIGTSHSVKEKPCLFRCWHELQLDSQLHTGIIRNVSFLNKTKECIAYSVAQIRQSLL